MVGGGSFSDIRSTLSDGNVYSQAIHALDATVHVWTRFFRMQKQAHLVGQAEEGSRRVMRIDTVFRFFGGCIFSTCEPSKGSGDFLQGQAHGFEVLFKIICGEGRRQLAQAWLDRSYDVVRRTLQRSTAGVRAVSAKGHAGTSRQQLIVLETVMRSSCRLFLYGCEPRAYMLIPTYLRCLDCLLVERVASGMHPSKDLREAAIQLLSMLLCLPNHLGQVKLGSVRPGGGEVRTSGLPFFFIKSQLSRLLLALYRLETDPALVHKVLGSLAILAREDWHVYSYLSATADSDGACGGPSVGACQIFAEAWDGIRISALLEMPALCHIVRRCAAEAGDTAATACIDFVLASQRIDLQDPNWPREFAFFSDRKNPDDFPSGSPLGAAVANELRSGLAALSATPELAVKLQLLEAAVLDFLDERPYRSSIQAGVLADLEEVPSRCALQARNDAFSTLSVVLALTPAVALVNVMMSTHFPCPH